MPRIEKFWTECIASCSDFGHGFK